MQDTECLSRRCPRKTGYTAWLFSILSSWLAVWMGSDNDHQSGCPSQPGRHQVRAALQFGNQFRVLWRVTRSPVRLWQEPYCGPGRAE